MEKPISPQMLRTAVRGVLNAWTALKIAAEERTGGYNSLLYSFLLIDKVITTLQTENDHISVCDVADVLSDYMDQKFNVICEDGSPEEVATDLIDFFRCYQNQDIDGYNVLMGRLPFVWEWLPNENTVPAFGASTAAQTSADPVQSVNEEPMEIKSAEEPVKSDLQDDGWTKVSNKRKSNS